MQSVTQRCALMKVPPVHEEDRSAARTTHCAARSDAASCAACSCKDRVAPAGYCDPPTENVPAGCSPAGSNKCLKIPI